MISLNVDYLPYEDIAAKAQEFLTQHKIESLPVPIEHIIEFNYGIDIVPLHDLQNSFDTEGFTSSDFTCIYVDNFVYHKRYLRYRYTLAHEIGHVVLHKNILDKFSFDSVLEWKNFVDQIDPKDHSKMEFQGYAFGGLILVPRQHLQKLFEIKLPEVMPLIDQAKNNGIGRSDYLSYAKDRLATLLAPEFEVSTEVIIRRIEYDSLDKQIP